MKSEKEIEELADRLSLNTTPYDWLSKAHKVKQSAEILFDKLDTEQTEHDEKFEQTADFTLESPDWGVAMMLVGFAIENLLKGLLVSTLDIKERPKRLRDLGFQNHDLQGMIDNLPDDLKPALDDSEKRVIEPLEHAVFWRGRYPSPTDARKHISKEQDVLFVRTEFKYPDDQFGALSVYYKLEEKLSPRAPFEELEGLLRPYKRGLMPGEKPAIKEK